MSNYSTGDLRIDFFVGELSGVDSNLVSQEVIRRFAVTIPRVNPQTWTAEICDEIGRPFSIKPGNVDFVQRDASMFLRAQGNPTVSLDSLFSAMRDLHNAQYVPAFRNIVNVGGQSRYFDIEIGEQFVKQWRRLKSAYEKPGQAAAYEITRLIARIFGFDGLEINPSQDERTLHILTGGRSYRLDEIGAGVSQFVLTLINVAIRRPSLILIDEPETGLHPMLQRDFMNTLASFASCGTLFATHSIGLARSTADRLYTVYKDESGHSRLWDYQDTPRLSEFLGELSFSSYRDLGFDCILLVEGPTDVRVFQELLRRYDKDQYVVILPLGGSDTVNAKAAQQLEEIRRITTNVFAVVDSDRSGPGNAPAGPIVGFHDVCQRAGVNCLVLERRAIENYFPMHAVQDTLGTKFHSLAEYDPLPAGWRKEINWRIASRMHVSDLRGTDLDVFLKAIVAKLPSKAGD